MNRHGIKYAPRRQFTSGVRVKNRDPKRGVNRHAALLPVPVGTSTTLAALEEKLSRIRVEVRG